MAKFLTLLCLSVFLLSCPVPIEYDVERIAITVNGSSAGGVVHVERGTTKQFGVTVTPSGAPQKAAWSLIGNNIADGTFINPDTGLLTVAMNQTSPGTFTVKAVSAGDNAAGLKVEAKVTVQVHRADIWIASTAFAGLNGNWWGPSTPPAARQFTENQDGTYSRVFTTGNSNNFWFRFYVVSSIPSASGYYLAPAANDQTPPLDTAINLRTVSSTNDSFRLGHSGTFTMIIDRAKSTLTIYTGVYVSSVFVNPSIAMVNQGSERQFNAVVSGANNPSQDVNWSIEGVNITGAEIDDNGLLKIAANQSAGTSITVKATSAASPIHSGSAAVTIREFTGVPTIYGINISPSRFVRVEKGGSIQFSSDVDAAGPGVNTGVNWSVEGGAAGTNITANGLLTVSVNETAKKLLVIAAPLQQGFADKADRVTVTIPSYSSQINSKGRYGNYYEIFLGSFYDSNGDGMGDLRGVIEKLDYLNDGDPDTTSSLGIDGIWFMPINPSDSYHKYDVKDYIAIDSAYGTMQDFEDLITACNERGIRVIIDLVPNHTSSGHNWFVRARSGNPGVYRNYYNFSNTKTNDKYYSIQGWNSNTPPFYEAVFWDQMPDLNWDNPAVKTEMEGIIDFWHGKGVAGFRLDAVKHIYETYFYPADHNQNHGKNVEWLRWFINNSEKKPDSFVVAEVWEHDIGRIRQYYQSGIQSNFNFYAAQDRIPNAVKGSISAHDFAQHVVNWNNGIKQGNSGAIDSPFTSNHDINRIATVIGNTGNSSSMIKMAAALTIFMPGNPFIYYGDELGITGSTSDGDQNVRGPMRWSRTNRSGETRGPAWNSTPYWDASSVEEQLTDENSILRFYIEAIKLKNSYPQIHWGSPSIITTSQGNSVAAYRINSGTNEKDLAIVHNLSNTGRTVTITGAASLGGTLTASSAAAKPSLSGASLTLPAFTTAVIEF